MCPLPGGAWFPADQFGTCEITAEKNALVTRSTDGKSVDWFTCDDEALLSDYRQEVYRMVQLAKLKVPYFPTYAKTSKDVALPSPAAAGPRSVKSETTHKAA
ncbi:MAG: hypothetical protein WCJ64_06425 [Rhodospirillaceae bacterium]